MVVYVYGRHDNLDFLNNKNIVKVNPTSTSKNETHFIRYGKVLNWDILKHG